MQVSRSRHASGAARTVETPTPTDAGPSTAAASAGVRRRPAGRGSRVVTSQPEQLRFGAATRGSDVIVPEEWRSPTVLSVPVAGKLLDLSRQGAYDAVARSDIPAIRIGRKLVVPVAKLRRLLDELPAADEAV